MKRFGPWITNFFIIAAAVLANHVDCAKKPGVKAVILYTYDDATVGSSVVSMEVDKATFMGVIKDSQFSAKAAKPLKFAEDNGFFALLEGDSSAFSFATSSGMADCDCKCVKRLTTTTTTTTTTTPRTTTSTTTTTPRTTRTTTTSRTSTIPPTYLPPTTKPSSTPAPGYLPPPTTPNPCPSGGSGPFCCVNGATNKDCCANGGSGPDCCTNGGRGKYCCTNGANNPDCCANGGKGTNCCLNGENKPGCQPIEKPKCPNGGTGPFCCKNGASNVDCCTNGGIGKFCCKNGATNQDCCENGGKGKYCCTNGFNNPGCTPPTFTTKATTRFHGPPYLPVATKSTTRGPTTIDTYTYGSRPTNTYRYSYTNGGWSGATRNYTVTYRETSSTVKYDYKGGDKRLPYNGEENDV